MLWYLAKQRGNKLFIRYIHTLVRDTWKGCNCQYYETCYIITNINDNSNNTTHVHISLNDNI